MGEHWKKEKKERKREEVCRCGFDAKLSLFRHRRGRRSWKRNVRPLGGGWVGGRHSFLTPRILQEASLPGKPGVGKISKHQINTADVSRL